METAMTKTPLVTPILIAGCAVLMISFAIRASFGVFQIPVAEEFGWARAEFSLAIAIQNLAWGIGQPIFGALAERFGDRRAIIAGALLYAAGLVLSAYAVTPGEHEILSGPPSTRSTRKTTGAAGPDEVDGLVTRTVWLVDWNVASVVPDVNVMPRLAVTRENSDVT